MMAAPASSRIPAENSFALANLLLDWPYLAYLLGRLATLFPSAHPIVDPDFWGYLSPALRKLIGSEFGHTQGRNFLYPGFLYLLLRASGDFRAITISSICSDSQRAGSFCLPGDGFAFLSQSR